jgi:hypothetical protein
MHARLGACVLATLLVAAVGCSSPEARRTRDGGPGADVGNKDLTNTPAANPQAADTTLWPGRAPAPVERFARGEIRPPVGVSSAVAAPGRGGTATTPRPASKADQSTLDKGNSANPRAPARPPAPPP